MDSPRDLVLDHHQHPRNHVRLDAPTLSRRGSNPLCGDELELSLLIDPHTAIITEIGCISRGCSIVRASASLMTECVKGQPRDDALEFARIVGGARGLPSTPIGAQLQVLQDLQLMYPARMKCVLLAWTTLSDALHYHASVTSHPD